MFSCAKSYSICSLIFWFYEISSSTNTALIFLKYKIKLVVRFDKKMSNLNFSTFSSTKFSYVCIHSSNSLEISVRFFNEKFVFLIEPTSFFNVIYCFLFFSFTLKIIWFSVVNSILSTFRLSTLRIIEGGKLENGNIKQTLRFFNLKWEDWSTYFESKRLRIPFFLSDSSIFWLKGVFFNCI